MNDLITTTDAARIAGVGVTSIKRWADQSLIRVQRTPGGHRRIVKSDLIRFLRQSETVQAPADRPNGNGRSQSDSIGRSDPAHDGSYWADMILTSDALTLQGLLLQARGRLGAWTAVADEVGLGLREIGLRWRTGTLSALDEHIATERLARALAFLGDMMPQGPSASVCLLICVPGDQHTLGLGLVEVCLREAGWATLWVGSSTPVTDLLTAISGGDIQMVALSASASSDDREALSAYADLIGTECDRSGVALVLGGRGAWPDTPNFGSRVHTFAEFTTLGRVPR